MSLSNSLPDFCFIFDPLAEPGKYVKAIRRGELGCFDTSYDERDPKKAEALVDHMNNKLQISQTQKECMETGSLFGWHVPGADPEQVGLRKLGKAKEMAASVAKELGAEISPWRRSQAMGLWEYTELQIEGQTLTIGASSGGIVSVNGSPFDPDLIANDNQATVKKSIEAVVARRQGQFLRQQPDSPESEEDEADRCGCRP